MGQPYRRVYSDIRSVDSDRALFERAWPVDFRKAFLQSKPFAISRTAALPTQPIRPQSKPRLSAGGGLRAVPLRRPTRETAFRPRRGRPPVDRRRAEPRKQPARSPADSVDLYPDSVRRRAPQPDPDREPDWPCWRAWTPRAVASLQPVSPLQTRASR